MTYAPVTAFLRPVDATQLARAKAAAGSDATAARSVNKWETLRELTELHAPEGQYMNIVALRPDGEHAGFTTVPGKQYLYFSGDMDEPALAPRLQLDGD